MFRVWGLGLWAWSLGFVIWGQGLGFRVNCLVFRDQGLELSSGWDLGFGNLSLGLGFWGHSGGIDVGSKDDLPPRGAPWKLNSL